MTIEKNLSDASKQLAITSDSPQLDAELLLSFILHQPRSYLHAHAEDELTAEQVTQFNDCIRRRANGEPIAYITGSRAFWKFELEVTPDVLIPRPETELLIELALELFPENRAIKLADLGTGSGAIALALAYERPEWQIYATDVSESALAIADNNAQQLGLKNVAFFSGNWCTALLTTDFDVIVSNPPYIAESEWKEYAEGLKYEPKLALTSGEAGLDAIQEIANAARHYLKPGGYLLVEHGFAQGAAVRSIFESFGFSAIKTMVDLSGKERVTVGSFFWNNGQIWTTINLR